MTKLLIFLFVGIVLLSEACSRVFHDKPLTVYYNLRHPFFIRKKLPFVFSLVITYLEIVGATALLCRSLMQIIHH